MLFHFIKNNFFYIFLKKYKNNSKLIKLLKNNKYKFLLKN